MMVPACLQFAYLVKTPLSQQMGGRPFVTGYAKQLGQKEPLFAIELWPTSSPCKWNAQKDPVNAEVKTVHLMTP